MSLYMLNATQGWGAQSTGVLKTTDGGAPWTNVTPRTHSPPNGVFHNGFFLSASTGWVLYYNQGKVEIFRTTDGGAKW